jgi:hypothetical protein
MKATRIEKGPLPNRYVPGHNELRPTEGNPAEREGDGREKLRYAQPNQMVHDYGSDTDGYPSVAPASARYTRGLPARPVRSRDTDDDAPTIQPGIPRVR